MHFLTRTRGCGRKNENDLPALALHPHRRMQRRVLCRIPNATLHSKCWAARSIMLDGANPGLALRCGGISGIINPVPQIFLEEVCVSHALLGRQSQPDRTHSAPTYWLQERLREPPSVSLLPHIGGIKRMPTKTGQGTGLGE